MSERERERLWTGTFVLVVVLTFVCFLVGQGVNSSLSVFITTKGGSGTLAGALAAIFSASAAASRLVYGPLIDQYGRRPFLIVGFALFLVGLIGPLVNASTPAFVMWRILQGFGFSGVTSAAATAAADVLCLSRLGEGIGYHGLGQAIAMSIGPAIGLWLVGTDPAENVFVGLSILAVVGLVLACACTYERHPERLPHSSAYYQRSLRACEDSESHETDKDCEARDAGEGCEVRGVGEAREGGEACKAHKPCNADKDCESASASKKQETLWQRIFEPQALPGMLPILVLSPVFGFSIYFCGLYGTTLGVGNAGIYFTLSAITMILVRLAGKRFMDSVGPLWLMGVAVIAGLITGVILMAATAMPVLFYVAGPFYGVCIGLGVPVNQSVAVKCTPAHRWGAANALFMLSQDVGIGVASVAWGIVNDCWGFSASLGGVMVLAVLSLVVAWFAYPYHGLRPLEAQAID